MTKQLFFDYVCVPSREVVSYQFKLLSHGSRVRFRPHSRGLPALDHVHVSDSTQVGSADLNLNLKRQHRDGAAALLDALELVVGTV